MNCKKLIVMGLVVTMSMSMVACGTEEKAAVESNKVAVEVENPERGSLETETVYVGTVAPEEQVYVIPKTSGTVTETFFEVGDTVQAGDVLFKIDDEAAQLQMASAKATYETAQAGVVAQNGGARDLQNYQTEQQIQTLKDSLYDTEDSIDDMEDQLGDLRESEKSLSKQLKEAKESGNTQLVEILQAQISSIKTAKEQLKSGIESAENGVDTIKDNITLAENSYNITQNSIYPQADAASNAQLEQASIAIDSAKMQLDFCTVTAPISGVVESVNVEKNGMAAAGSAAYIISNKDSMSVSFYVTEKAKQALQIGDSVRVERNGESFEAAITEIGTMASAQTKLFQIKAAISGAGDKLPNGVSVKVYATTQREKEKLIVPYDSIYFSAGDAYVYCVEGDTLVKTEVTVGLMSETEAVIEEGLSEDSLVVKNWSSKLRNGAEAQIISSNGKVVEEVEETEEMKETEEVEASETAETEEAE